MPDLIMRSIRDLGMASPTVREAMNWILSMTLAADREDGASFWAWIEENNRIVGPETIYNTFLFIDRQTQRVVATASIVRDDRGVGARFEMTGVWLGGVNVKRDVRGQGIGNRVAKMVHEWIQKQARDRQEDIRVNLFTANHIAMRVYEHLGFQRVGIVNVSATTATIYFKIYGWKTREKSEMLKYISDLNTRALTYHNHKEASAWTALALYYLMMFAWIVPLALHEPLLNQRLWRWIGVGVLAIVTGGVAYYIKKQLDLRRYFGDVTGACYILGAKCLHMDENQINKLDLSGGVGNHRDRAIPQFIRHEMDNVAKVPHRERMGLDFAQRTLFWTGAGVVITIMLIGRDFAEIPSLALKEGVAPVVDQMRDVDNNIAGINQALDKVRSELVSVADVKANIVRAESDIAGLSRSVAEIPSVPLRDIIADLAAMKADIAALKQPSTGQDILADLAAMKADIAALKQSVSGQKRNNQTGPSKDGTGHINEQPGRQQRKRTSEATK
jgi:RimJ/RimL family protein N-acetyltransferase